jgi:hypothetical protein
MNIQQLQSMRGEAKGRKAPKTSDKASSNEASAKKAQKGVGKAAQ